MNKEKRRARKTAKKAHRRKVGYERSNTAFKISNTKKKTAEKNAYKYYRFMQKLKREDEVVAQS